MSGSHRHPHFLTTISSSRRLRFKLGGAFLLPSKLTLKFSRSWAAFFSHLDIGAPSVGFVTMWFSSRNRCFLVLLLLAQTVVFTSTQDDQAESCDPQCKTNSCGAAGNCLCLQPDTNTYTFLGGEYCDQPAHVCQVATDPSFWCLDNDGNSTCGTLADGSATCFCHAGYAGDKCDIVGTACGVGYCYNNATCLNGATCSCPPDWQGNGNCSLATPDDGGSSGSSIKWWGGLLIAGAVAAAVSVGGVFAVKKYKERTEGANRFNELKKSQMRARAESDDEYDSDPYEDEVHAKQSTRAAQP